MQLLKSHISPFQIALIIIHPYLKLMKYFESQVNVNVNSFWAGTERVNTDA